MLSPGNLPLSIVRGIEFPGAILQCRDYGLAVTGTLAPNVVGTYPVVGTYAAFPLFILGGSPATFCYYNTAAASYVIARTLTDAALTDYWSPAVPITEATGTYLPHGANTGTATATDHPVDLTGFTAEAKVRRTVNATDVLIDLAPTITNAATGEITIPTISTATTKALQFTGNFMWDLVLVSGGQRFGPFVQGKFVISDNVTQEP